MYVFVEYVECIGGEGGYMYVLACLSLYSVLYVHYI